ncbi:hypothetical protein [Streptomyces sp. NPDC058874]|uniref:hypothetical protein n=1 Tax=unclassified Streptomyces TaxID=2593676 RepID=UPI0036817967
MKAVVFQDSGRTAADAVVRAEAVTVRGRVLNGDVGPRPPPSWPARDASDGHPP